MRMKYVASCLLCLLIFIACHNTYAQKQNNQWRFGYGAAVDFNNNPPINVVGSAIFTQEGSASVADRNSGALLFYTDGGTVWNALHQVMPNGNGLSGGTGQLSSTTAAVIIPRPGNANQYYVVTIDDGSSGGGTSGVRYSLIDMTLAGGLGDIVSSQKNIFLYQTPSEKLEYAPAANGTDYWVISHDNESFSSFLLTASGFQTPAVVSNVASGLGNTAGHLKINRQFNVLACGSLFQSSIRLFNFNNSTGQISDFISWTLNPGILNSSPLIYGIEFSPSGELLYVSNINSVYQYDISIINQIAIQNSAFQVSMGGQPASVQLGPNQKIYINNGSLDVINCPNNRGASCDFQSGTLIGGGYGLPKWVYYPKDTAALYQNSITYSDSCLGNTIQFSVRNTAGISKITWNFGDPASGAGNTATGFSANHIFSQTGNFTIQAILTNACGFDTLFINSLSIINCQSSCTGSISSKDTCVLNGSTFQIISSNTINSVSWNFDDPSSGTGNTSTSLTPTHLFSSAGTFGIRAIINFSCGVDTLFKTISIINCDSIQEDCQIFFPNAFTPNSDGDNDHFNPLTICALEHYECLVFSRWGELIFQTFNQNEKWDGRYNGIDCSTGIYIYLVKYKLPQQPFKNINGTITLLR